MENSFNFPIATDLDALQGPNPNREISKIFRAADADVTFVSSDNMLFYIHRKNLETHCAGIFAAAEFETRGEVVPLTETSSTLELLFQFMYPRRQPDLVPIPFEALGSLAEAAEKYEVFSAMTVCRIRMENTLPEHAAEIFNYASRHGYKDILGLAAPLMLDIPFDEIIKALSPGLIVPWIRYRECWTHTAFHAITTASDHYHVSSDGTTMYCYYHGNQGCNLNAAVLPAQLWVSLGERRSRKALLELYARTSNVYTCNYNQYDYRVRRTRLEDALQTIPTLDTFL